MSQTSSATYSILETIHQSPHTIVHRAVRQDDQREVILKQLNIPRPTPLQIARFESEYDITRFVASPYTVEPLGYEPFGGSYIIVLVDTQSVALDLYIQNNALSLLDTLKIAVQLVDALDVIHQKQVIHKDINPSNILYRAADQNVKLIDFSISTRLAREAQQIVNLQQLQGTLAYISPEQTGRMNRPLDYRTDFYSLGVTLYELFTGRLPFETADEMEMIHSHLARQPLHPSHVNADCPPIVGDIVMRLMAKTAEERYQTAYGLKADLQTCLTEWEANRQITDFPLGKNDKTSYFDVPQKLYGREHEKRQLLEAFDRVSSGGAELLLVSGAAGIGKSFFINEIHKPIVAQHGYFASGKFDQYRRNIPYDALIQVFRSLVRQLLTEDQERLALWRHNLNQAFGENGAVLTDVIPELELIVGQQPAVPELDPIPTQNRFNRYLLLMLQVLATEEHPIVAFLDDLHWGDAASLQLLQTILNAADVRHLLLIGAYRPEELSETHPFRVMLQVLKQPPVEIQLRPFGLGPIQQIVSDTIHQSGTHVAELAQVVEEKTHGNPFFVNEFLNNLYDKKLLTFDFESGKWQWDLKEIRAVSTTDNVVDLLTHKIQQLSAAEQEALQWGACMGGEFTLALYADVRQQSRTEAAVTLWPAVKEGLLILIGDTHRLAQDSQIDLQNISNLDISYQFAHDRVQQAAYLLIEAAQLPQMHYQIGRRRLDAHTAEELDNALFDVVNQLNQGLKLVTDVDEKREIAHLNLQAGQKAQAAIAFKAAADYYYLARDLLPDNYWQAEYQLALDIYNQLFVCEYLNGRFEEADALFRYIQQHAQNALDIAQTYSRRVYMLQNLDENEQAVDTALQGLRELGINLAKKPSVFQIAHKGFQVWQLLRGCELEKLIAREEESDPQKEAILAIFGRLATASYFISREFTVYINLARMVTALQFKNTPSTGHALVAFGFVMAAGLGRYEYGERLGHVGTEISKKYAGEVWGDLIVYDGMTRPWVRPLRDCMPYLQEAYQKLLNSGEILTPVYAYQLLTMQMVFHSVPLSHIETELPTYRKSVELSQDPSAIHYLAVLERFLMALRGETESPTSLSDDEFSEDELLHKIKTGNMPVILHRYYIHKLHLHYLFGEYQEAQAIAEASAEVLAAGFGIMVYLAEHHFYHALTLLTIYHDGSKTEQRQWSKSIRKSLKQLRKWAKLGSENLLHRVRLVEAELARIQGKKELATEAYDQAIELAHRQQSLQIEALAYELAGRFALSQNRPRMAQIYMAEAYYRYALWGSETKRNQLQSLYPQWFATSSAEGSTKNNLATITKKPLSSTRDEASTLDLQSVMQAAQLFTGELQLHRLIERLMMMTLENSGAEKAVLLRPYENEWRIEAISTVEESSQYLERPLKITADLLPTQLINFVARTHETIILDNALEDKLLINDLYVQTKQTRSVLCMPLTYKGETSAMLYLENNLTTGAFPVERVEPLKILSAQMAASLENATLFSNLQQVTDELAESNRTLEQKVEERTAQLAEATRAAEAANKAKSSFLAGMSHEIRTPLNAIIGYSEMMLEDAESAATDHMVEDTKRVISSGRHLLELINQVLDLSKIEAGRMELHLEEFAIVELVLDAKITLQPLMEKNKNDFKTEFDVSQLGVMRADYTKLKQSLLNLLSNAAKFTHQGTVVLRVERYERNNQRAWIDFVVADTGIGMSEEQVAKIFDPFTQADSSTTRNYGGTGLGLSITQHFCEMMGGTLTVESEEEHGTTFVMSIPAEVAEP